MVCSAPAPSGLLSLDDQMVLIGMLTRIAATLCRAWAASARFASLPLDVQEILALQIYAKNERDNFSANQRKVMPAIIANHKAAKRAKERSGMMTKHDKNRSLGDALIASLQEGMDILQRKTTPARFYAAPGSAAPVAPAPVSPAPVSVDVQAIRRGLGLSQPQFAQRFGFSVGTVRGWEQGLRQPDMASRVLLLVIARRPEVVDEVLAGAQVAA